MLEKYYPGDIVEILNLSRYSTEEISFALYKDRQRVKRSDLIGERYKVCKMWDDDNGSVVLDLPHSLYSCAVPNHSVTLYKRSFANWLRHLFL